MYYTPTVLINIPLRLHEHRVQVRVLPDWFKSNLVQVTAYLFASLEAKKNRHLFLILSISLRSRQLVKRFHFIRLSLRSRQLVDQTLLLSLSFRSRQFVDKSLFLASRFAWGNWLNGLFFSASRFARGDLWTSLSSWPLASLEAICGTVSSS